MNFALFVLLNAILLIRPEELFPAIAGVRLYLLTIALCTLTSLPALGRLLDPASWRAYPLTPFLLAYLALFTFSGVPSTGFRDVGLLGEQVLKNGLYVFLFLGTVDSISRFKALLGWFVAFIAVVSALSVLQYHGYTNFEVLNPYREGHVDPETGEFIGSIRLRGSGICGDPNDFCQVLLLGSICSLARAALAREWFLSVPWLLPIGLFAYAVTLTHSRGGLLGILAGVAGLLFIRFGSRTGALLVPVVVVAGVLAAGGRQASYSMDGNDTSQHRLHLWAESLNLLSQKPLCYLTGLGHDAIASNLGLVAHNSFVQAYVETGLIGGTLFTCLLVAPLLVIFQMRRPSVRGPAALDRIDLYRLRGHVFGILAGFAVGCFSLTRNGNEMMHLFVGLAACYLALARHTCPAWFKLDRRFGKVVAALGLALLVFLKFFTQAMAVY